MATIKARRLLNDLFMEGVEIRFGKDPKDGKPRGWVGPFENDRGERKPCPQDQVAMFIRPADPLQREQAMREANAKRARALVRSKREKDSEEHLTIMAFLADMSDETLIDYVVQSETNTRLAEAEREILAFEEWKEMDSYRDAMRQFDEMDPEELHGNEEWEALLELDKKYADQVTNREGELREAQREALRMQIATQRHEIERKALERRSDLVGTQAFMQEYELQMTFFSVRDIEDPSKLFFDNAAELAAQPEHVRDIINEALLPFITEPEQAKNSQRADSGSQQSEPPRKPETSEASTHEELSA